MNLRDLLISKLIEAKIPSPRLEADIIIRNSIPNYPLMSDDEKNVALDFLARRLNHEPLDKIIGKKEFYKYEFKVNSDVLSPRPDSEILVEKAIEIICKRDAKIADLGVGSGCLIISILKECPNATGVGIDISEKALNIAKTNAELLGVNDRILFLKQTFNDAINLDQKFDVIISNPPYIPVYEIDDLDEEVKSFDPIEALVGGDDGLLFYRQIAKTSKSILQKDGYILLEVGYNQAETVSEIFLAKGFKLIEIVKDLAQINRCVILKK
ncbi:MAG: peptide chain release factor N(5)-glutamine methyltransferase [Alphaproteobacteria bacterium]|nr:peptide chain release factor N(5)-glutamine methyltransferase [Alphaproteobacteria bacterium]